MDISNITHPQEEPNGFFGMATRLLEGTLKDTAGTAQLNCSRAFAFHTGFDSGRNK
jgi:hypothetical protein